MSKEISDIMLHCYDMWSNITTEINFSNAIKMCCALMFIISNHYGLKCLSNLVWLVSCNDVFKVISHIMAPSYEMCNTIISTINFCIAKKMNCALMVTIE